MTVNVFTSLIDLTGTADPGFVIFRLMNFFGFIPVVASTGIFSEVKLKTKFGTSFSINIEPNDLITPSNTYYLVQVYDEQGRIVSEATYQFLSTIPSVDLSNYPTYIPSGVPGGTTPEPVPEEAFLIRAVGLQSNYNSGVPVLVATPSTTSEWRISFYEALDVPAVNSGSGSSISTMPSLTLNYTDAGGIARTLVLVATDIHNSTTLSIHWGVVPIYVLAGQAITLTSAGYASSPVGMAYELAVTAENMS